MELFWTFIADIEESRLLHPGRSRAPGSAFAWSLLAYVLAHTYDAALPEVGLTDSGKPCFPACPALQFSLSHTRGAVLAAVSQHPVGADVEHHRPVREATARRLLEAPHGDLELFELWTLRESWFKLTGAGDLRSIPFSRENGVIMPPARAFCRLYHDIPDCTAAVCSLLETPPETARFVDPDLLIR